MMRAIFKGYVPGIFSMRGVSLPVEPPLELKKQHDMQGNVTWNYDTTTIRFNGTYCTFHSPKPYMVTSAAFLEHLQSPFIGDWAMLLEETLKTTEKDLFSQEYFKTYMSQMRPRYAPGNSEDWISLRRHRLDCMMLLRRLYDLNVVELK